MNTDIFILSPCLSHPPACSLCLWTLADQWGCSGLLELLLVVPQSLQSLLGCSGIWAKKENKTPGFFTNNLLKCFPLFILGPAWWIHLNTLYSSLFLFLLSWCLGLIWSPSGTQSLSILQLHLEAAGTPEKQPWTTLRTHNYHPALSFTQLLISTSLTQRKMVFQPCH